MPRLVWEMNMDHADTSFSGQMRARRSNPDNDGLGIELGHLCITHNYSVKEVAERFEVTPATIYNWMAGRSLPSGARLARLKELVQRLKELSQPHPADDQLE